MPGLLGLEAPADEMRLPQPQAERALVPDRLVADWRELVADLQHERRQLSDEVTGLRGLVVDLSSEVQRLAGMLELVQQALPALTAPPTVLTIAGSSANNMAMQTVDAGAHTATASPPAPEEGTGAAAVEESPLLRMSPDFGWRDRPVATQEPLQPSESPAAANAREVSSAPEIAATPVAAAEIQRFPAGETIKLIVSPVRGVRLVAGIEGSLASCEGVGPLTLLSYRGGEARFRLALVGDTSLRALQDAILAGGASAVRCQVEDQGRLLRVELAAHEESGTT